MRSPVNTSTLHVLQILRLVCASEGPLSHAEISRRTALPPTTVYRALSTLEDAQYVQRAQSSQGYQMGIVPQLLLWALLKRFPLASAGLPFLERLAKATGGTASLCVKLGWYAVRVSVVYGGNDIYHRDHLGEVSLLHASPAARGIFAFLADKDLEPYRRFVLQHHESQARGIDKGSLRRDVTAWRALGYCAFASDDADASASYAMPLRRSDGAVVASLALNAMAFESDRENIPALPADCRAIWEDFGATLAAHPAWSVSPYDHLDPRDIVIKASDRQS